MSLSINNQISRIKPLYDYLRKKRENYRFVRTVEISATFILITFFLIFAIRPTVLTISSLWGDIQSKQILKKQMGSQIDNIVKAQDLFSLVQENYQIVNDSLPDRPEYSLAASQLQQVGNNSGLSLDSFGYDVQSNDKVSPNANVKNYQIPISISGSFTSVTKIIADLLQNRRLIDIGSISIGPSGTVLGSTTAGPSGVVTANFNSVYYYWSPSK
jgi:Tfp pilus assembly protein PilO